MKFLRFSLLLLFVVTAVNAQQHRERLFKDVDLLMGEANRLSAELLAPQNYNDAMANYKSAQNALESGDDLVDIQNYINKSVSYFTNAISFAKSTAENYVTALDAREDALKAKADQNAAELFKKADDTMSDAASEVENKDKRDANEYAFEAEKLYRQAELNAIKFNHLNLLWDLLKSADDEGVEGYAPLTLKKAKELANSAEKEIENNRYETAVPDQMIKDGIYETNHAFFIKEKIEEINENDLSYEQLLLSLEEPLQNVGDVFKYRLDFSKGLDEASKNLVAYVKKNTVSNMTDLQAELESANERISGYKNKLENFDTENNPELKKALGLLEFDKKVKEIESLFSKSEVEVLKGFGEVTLRLKALRFDVGSYIIQPKHFSLLSRTQEAIEKFSSAQVVVLGHTDNQGNAKVNNEVSSNRASAVAEYLKVNIKNSNYKIHFVGYGESKPIANNELESGRDKNRRIEVKISLPELAE